MRGGWLAMGVVLPGLARAHGTGVGWDAPPSQALQVLLPLVAGGLLYAAGVARRRLGEGSARQALRGAAFFTALALLLVALVWPLDAWAQVSFAAHMAQHMVLLALAPPLLLLGRPGAAWLRALPARWRAAAVRPRRWPAAAAWRRISGALAATAVLHGAVLWGWHLPVFFELALRSAWIHWLEHVTLLAAGVLYWRALLRARGVAAGWAMVSMLATVIHSGLLGALLALSPRVLYPTYAQVSAAALEDQQLAGLIMWVPMGTVYLVAALVFAARALRHDEPAWPSRA